MSHYFKLPASTAMTEFEPLLVDGKINFTFTESLDEGKLYNELNERLITLEVSLRIDRDNLQAIKDDAKGLRLLVDEREEVQMRIDWLKRLNKVQEELENVQTKEGTQKLLRYISSCQTSPLKKQLTSKLETLVESLPSEQVEEIQMTSEEILMEFAIEKAGNDFINLGRAGREYVVAKSIDKYGENAEITQIRDIILSLEENVERLKECNNQEELISQLEQLPLFLFHSLEVNRKEAIAKRLIEQKNWNGLAELDRIIIQLDKAIINEEHKREESKYTIQTETGIAAIALNIENDIGGIIKIG